MLASITRWFSRQPQAARWPALEAWSAERGWTFKTSRQLDGFVIEALSEGWRLEWGPSHRRYLGSHELRLRADTGLHTQGHAAIMPKGLLTTLERNLFDEFVEGVQTRLDDATPEEVRWLAMSPKLSATELGPLKDYLAVVGNIVPWLNAWLAGATGHHLEAMMAERPMDGGAPFALVLQQGQLVLRMGLTEPDPAALTEAARLFKVALAEARLQSASAEPA